LQVTFQLSLEVIAAIAIPFLLLSLAAIAGNMIQHRLVWSVEALKPKLHKISPAAGLKRLFSKQALANFFKGLAKLVLIGAVMTALLWPERDRLDGLVALDPAAILPVAQAMALKVLGAIVAILAVIAAADYLFQYRQWFERQKNVGARTERGIQANRRRPGHQGQDPAAATVAHAQTHDGGGAAGVRGYH